MDDTKNILKELRVDWDFTLQDSFNPFELALRASTSPALHKSFHGLFHRLEHSMAKIISSNYHSFSESFATFGKYRTMNSQIIKEYGLVEHLIPALKLFQSPPPAEKTLELNLDTLGVSAKYEICAKIVNARNTYKKFLAETSPAQRTASIITALNILEDQAVSQIKGAFEYYKVVFKSYTEFVDEVNGKLLDYVVRNELENARYFNTMIELQALARFEEFCSSNFRDAVFRMVEDVIQATACGEAAAESGGLLGSLCRSIAAAVEIVVENMEHVIGKCRGFSAEDVTHDFFGKKRHGTKFLQGMGGCMEAIKDVLRVFLERYSLEPGESVQFDINMIPDTFDYTKVYAENTRIFKWLAEAGEGKPQNQTVFTLITFTTPEVIPRLLGHLKSKELSDYLYKTVELKYFAGGAVDDKVYKLQGLIREICDENSPAAAGLARGLAVAEVTQLLDSCIAARERATLESWARKCLAVSFLHFYDRTFTSEFIRKEPDFRRLLESLDRHYGYVDDDGNGFIYHSMAGELDELKIREAAASYLLPIDQFKSKLVRQSIKKTDLIHRRRRYERIRAMVGVLRQLAGLLASREVGFLADLFEASAARQVLLDFFYYFDLLYREGSYFYYLRLCCESLENYTVLGLESMRDFEGCLNSYCRENIRSIKVKSKAELGEFVEMMEVFSNVLSSDVDISGVVEFFVAVKDGVPNSSEGKKLLQKIE